MCVERFVKLVKWYHNNEKYEIAGNTVRNFTWFPKKMSDGSKVVGSYYQTYYKVSFTTDCVGSKMETTTIRGFHFTKNDPERKICEWDNIETFHVETTIEQMTKRRKDHYFIYSNFEPTIKPVYKL